MKNSEKAMASNRKAQETFGSGSANLAARLRKLADEMDDIAVTMDYYGGLAEWSRHGREIAGAGAIARQWAGEIEASNVIYTTPDVV